MCACGQPTINGQPGYKWQPEHPPSVHPLNPPDLQDTDTPLFDEPGRCGGQDSHSFHYRVVRRLSTVYLLTKHGGGNAPTIRVSNDRTVLATLAAMDTNSRYWILNAIFHAACDAEMRGHAKEIERWRQAAAEKRIRTRKQPGRNAVKVWIDPKIVETPA